MPDNTEEDAAQMGCVQRHGIFCAMHYDRRSSQKRKNKENGCNRVAWDFYSTVRVSFTAIGVVNSIEVTDSSWSQ